MRSLRRTSGVSPPKSLLRSAGIDDTAVFFVQERRVDSAEDFLPPETIAGDQQDVPRLELLTRQVLAGLAPRRIPQNGAPRSMIPRTDSEAFHERGFSSRRNVRFRFSVLRQTSMLREISPTSRSIASAIALPGRLQLAFFDLASACRPDPRDRSARGSPGKSMRCSKALVIGRLALLKLAERRNARVIGSLHSAVKYGSLRSRRAGEEVARVIEHDGFPRSGSERRNRGCLCSPPAATLNGAKLYGPMPNIAKAGPPR